MKVLYVEDHSAQRDILKQMLELMGYDVAVANNGEEGIQKAHEWGPDIILMDLRMPRMDGVEAVKQLRGDPTVANIPIIVLSAWTSRENQEKALQAGADKFLTKPVNINRLIPQINKLVSPAARKTMENLPPDWFLEV